MAANGPAGIDAYVLVVEDEPSIAVVLRDLLHDEGYRVEVAHDGHTALAILRAHPPRVLILDLMLPGLDGVGLLHALRADATLAEVPVVVVSAMARPEAAVEGVAVAAVIRKPFDIDLLLGAVRHHAADPPEPMQG